jgi:hypothetical protein
MKVFNQNSLKILSDSYESNHKINFAKYDQLFSELLSFWTLSIAQYSKKLENTTFRKLGLFLKRCSLIF